MFGAGHTYTQALYTPTKTHMFTQNLIVEQKL